MSLYEIIAHLVKPVYLLLNEEKHEHVWIKGVDMKGFHTFMYKNTHENGPLCMYDDIGNIEVL